MSCFTELLTDTFCVKGTCKVIDFGGELGRKVAAVGKGVKQLAPNGVCGVRGVIGVNGVIGGIPLSKSNMSNTA